MRQKTYGVFGWMEYTMNAALGKRVFQIPFTGGMANNRSVRPACYTTCNALVQYAVEHSPDYLCGRVVLVGEAEVPGRPSKGSSPASSAAASPAGGAGGGVSSGAPAPGGVPEGGQSVPAKGIEEIGVSCIDDARDILMQRFAVPSAKLRSWKAVEEQAALCGVRFVQV